MIHANRIVTVGEQESIIDRPIVLYRGDREVEIEFTLVGNEFTFSEEGNVIKSVNASHGQLVLNTPSGEHMFSELAECHEGKVVFVVTKEMIDEFIEMGFYSFQIRLYDSAEMKSRVTIPPVMNGFDIRNPIAAEDETNVVDQGIVDYARIFKDQSNEELPTFTWDGEYVKTEWAHHDVITENKLNKIEDALYSINANIKESDVVMLNALDNVKKDADKYVKEHMTEIEADVEEFERDLNTDVQKFKVDTNAAMTAHKNEVSEELEEFNNELEHIKNFVTPNMFGAKCDGVTDDSKALKTTHEYANQNGLDVKYPPNCSIYLKDIENIPVKTNVDFNGCEIIIDDTDTQYTENVFIIKNDIGEISLDPSTLAAIGAIKENSRVIIPQFAGYGDALIRLVNSNKQNYIRYGNNANSGENLKDYIIVDNSGEILVPCAYDFDTITSCAIKPISARTLTIENGNFKTIANRETTSFTYIARGIGVERNNVILKNINHVVDQDKNRIGKPYTGFLNFKFCARVNVENCALQPKFFKYSSSNVPKGTYDLGTDGLVDCTFDNLSAFSTSSDYWGVWGGNHMKNITIRNSELNRIDAHRGCFGLIVEHCKLGSKGFTLCGGWDLIINDVEVIGCKSFLELREDYGSSWKGSIKINNVSHYYDGDNPTIIAGTNVIDHDFGYDRYVGFNSVVVDNYHFKGKGASNSPYFINMIEKGTTKTTKHYLCENYSISNITFEGASTFRLLNITESNFDCLSDFVFNSLFIEGDGYHEMEIRPNIYFNVRNIDSQYGNLRYGCESTLGSVGTDNYTDVATRPIIGFNFINCSNLYLLINGYPSVCKISNSVIKRYVAKNGGTRNQAFINNCEFKPEGSSVMEMFRFNGIGTFINNCKFYPPLFGGVKYTESFTELQKAYEFLFNANQTSFKQMANISNSVFSQDIVLGTVFPHYSKYEEKIPNGTAREMKYIFNGNTEEFNTIKDKYPKYVHFYNTTTNKMVIKRGDGVWIDMMGNTI